MVSALPDLLGVGLATSDPLGKGFASSNPRGVGSVLPDPLYSASPDPGVVELASGRRRAPVRAPVSPNHYERWVWA
jgi:hypothetical protein